ncbi:hypothetical protein [Falsiroseomonas oryzae]|uniref:hypothetical protein n=1 Tax=Falsiroseomonas oryzae TaxID=2766473 RepID=UPI0022EACF25|nr:hypothetical protein [Roseomonas sp. MO-31]
MPANPNTTRCPTCGRRHAPGAKAVRPAPLLDWIERHKAAQRDRRPAPAGVRLVLRDDLRDAEGQPRACIVIPGRRLPLAFPSIPAALAALAHMEAAPHGR